MEKAGSNLKVSVWGDDNECSESALYPIRGAGSWAVGSRDAGGWWMVYGGQPKMIKTTRTTHTSHNLPPTGRHLEVNDVKHTNKLSLSDALRVLAIAGAGDERRQG